MSNKIPSVREMQEHLKEHFGIDEPLFVIRAKDTLSLPTLRYYYGDANVNGCSEGFLNAVATKNREFEEWQRANPDAVRLPD